MRTGNWHVGLFFDAAASREQAQKLSAVFSGKLGGPMARVAPVIGEMLGTVTAPISYSDDGRRHRVKVETPWRSRSRTSFHLAARLAR